MPSLPAIRSFTNLTVEKLEDRVTPTAPVGFVPDRVLVALDTSSPFSTSALNQVTTSARTKNVESLGFGIYKVNLRPGVAVDASVADFRTITGLRYASRDNLYAPQAVPNDPRFNEQWTHRNTGSGGGTPGDDVGSVSAWDIGTGTGQTIVAVIDSGVQYDHPDLAANMWVNPVDGGHGHDFGDNDNDPYPDLNLGGTAVSHGTHVAGIIGAVGNNGIGVAGMAWKTRIMAVKIASGAGALASLSSEVQAIGYAVANGAKVMNMSYGFDAGVLTPALDAAAAAGAIFVVSAGNDDANNDSDPTANKFTSPNVVVVAATDWNNRRSSFSNYGKATVNIGAPGGDQNRYGVPAASILSTFAVPKDSYEFEQGTSMASPTVAGALVTYWDANPDLTYAEVIKNLYDTVKPAPDLTDSVTTGGILDFAALMATTRGAYYATGAGAGGGPLVKVYRSAGGRPLTQFFAYDPVFTGGVRVITADVNGDGVTDIITVPGPGGGPHVKIYDGKTFQQIASFFAFESDFRGGLFVAARDMDGDKKAEIIVSADSGGGPRVSIFKPNLGVGATGATTVANFFAYDAGFTGGVRIATGDFTGDGLADLVVAPGTGGGPHVKVFSGVGLLTGNYDPIKQFMAGDVTNRNGLFVAAGDLNGDKVSDIIVGSGSGTPVMRVYDGATLNLTVQTFPTGGEVPGLVVDTTNIDGTLNNRKFPSNLLPPTAPPGQLPATTDKTQRQVSGYLYGIRVATQDVNNDGVPDVILAAGPADTPTVVVLDGKTLTPINSFNAYEDFFYGGVFVGGSGDPLPRTPSA